MISCCGLDCAICETFIATRDNNNDARKAIAEKWRVMYHNPNIKTEDINCLGCNSSGPLYQHCLECNIRLCAIDKKVANCGKCGEYPCTKISEFHKIVPEAKVNCDRISAFPTSGQ